MRRRKTSWLDQRVYRFQHRWETNPQYRAVVAGVCGLLLIILMCSCTGILATVTNAALAGSGGTANADGNTSTTGTKQLGSQQSFPTATIPPYVVSTIPAGNIPDSQTPGPTPTLPPAPTAVPTATPCQSGCGGGGGGGGGGGNYKITATWSPSTWVAGHQGTLYVHTTQPNVGYGLIINLPGVVTNTVEPAGMTDGNGNATFVYNVPSGVTTNMGHIILIANMGGSTYGDAYIPCAA